MIRNLPLRPYARLQALCRIFQLLDAFVEEIGLPYNCFAPCFAAMERMIILAEREAKSEDSDDDEDSDDYYCKQGNFFFDHGSHAANAGRHQYHYYDRFGHIIGHAYAADKYGNRDYLTVCQFILSYKLWATCYRIL